MIPPTPPKVLVIFKHKQLLVLLLCNFLKLPVLKLKPWAHISYPMKYFYRLSFPPSLMQTVKVFRIFQGHVQSLLICFHVYPAM